MDPADSDQQTSYPLSLIDLPIEEAKMAVENADDPTLSCTGGRNCLFYAAQRAEEKEALDLIQFILERVTNLDATTQDDFGQTPLFYAAREGYTTCMELLVHQCKLNVSHVDNAAQTPLFYAARDGRTDAVIWLVESGADINHVDGNGETPIFYAARDGRDETVYKMIELGADLTVRNKSKAFPSAIARKGGHRRLATELDNLRKQREVTQSGSSLTRKAEPKRRSTRKSAAAASASVAPVTPRASRRKRPLRGAEETAPSAKRRGRGRGTFDEVSVAEDEGQLDEEILTVSGVSSPASLGGSGKAASKSLLKESPAQSPKQTPRSIASSPAPSEDESLAQPVSIPPTPAPVGPNGRRGGKGPLLGHKPSTINSLPVTATHAPSSTIPSAKVAQDAAPLAGERQVYQLQFLAPGKAWSFATLNKVEEFEALFPSIAAWDKSASLPEVGLLQDPYRSKWHEQANELMQYLATVDGAWLLEEPVDPEKWGISDYFDIVKRPMDFSTIRARLGKGTHYRTVQEFVEDLELVFYNCILYNSGESEVGQLCTKIRAAYQTQARRLGLLDLLEAEERRQAISKQVVANALTKRNSQTVASGQQTETTEIHEYSESTAATGPAETLKDEESCISTGVSEVANQPSSPSSPLSPEAPNPASDAYTEIEVPLLEEGEGMEYASGSQLLQGPTPPGDVTTELLSGSDTLIAEVLAESVTEDAIIGEEEANDELSCTLSEEHHVTSPHLMPLSVHEEETVHAESESQEKLEDHLQAYEHSDVTVTDYEALCLKADTSAPASSDQSRQENASTNIEILNEEEEIVTTQRTGAEDVTKQTTEVEDGSDPVPTTTIDFEEHTVETSHEPVEQVQADFVPAQICDDMQPSSEQQEQDEQVTQTHQMSEHQEATQEQPVSTPELTNVTSEDVLPAPSGATST